MVSGTLAAGPSLIPGSPWDTAPPASALGLQERPQWPQNKHPFFKLPGLAWLLSLEESPYYIYTHS